MGYPYLRGRNPSPTQWPYWMHVFFITPHAGFDMVGHICADNEAAFDTIYKNTRICLQVRGLGSRRREVRRADGSMVEAPTPLMVVLSTHRHRNTANFRKAAVELVLHLTAVAEQYRKFCEAEGLRMLEPWQHLFGFAEWSLNCEEWFDDLIEQHPAPHLICPPDSLCRGALLGGKGTQKRKYQPHDKQVEAVPEGC